MDESYGALTAHAVGTLMKEAVRRAIVAIRAHRFTFETSAKNRVGEAPDFVTTADGAAQRVFVTLLQQWFPGFGIVAEEDSLRVPCTIPGRSLWFTVDPLDGTKAFIRRQSHGIGTMISLIDGDRVVAACVGDVMTSEVYASRPGDGPVHRVSEFGIAERLAIDPARPLGDQYLLRTQGRGSGSAAVHALGEGAGALFPGVESTTGSLGIAMARLWKGEVGGAVFGPFVSASPWDLYPVVGLSTRLGFRFHALGPDRASWGRPFEPDVSREGMAMPAPVLVIHESRTAELIAWLSAAGSPT